MYQRATYKEQGKHAKHDWTSIEEPVATNKYDGAHYYLQVESDGSARFFSRRQSVKGHFPERTSQVPHLTSKKLDPYAGNVYSVELIHTGHNPKATESHPAVSGILNSLPERAIQTQKETGPVRAVLIDVINPKLPTYKDKLLHMKEVEKHFGNPDLLFVPTPAVGHKAVAKLIEDTKKQGKEGVIITSLTKPEENNVRVKVKHKLTYNLRISKILQEFDKYGKPKPSMGAVVVVDRSGREVANVGTGWSAQLRKEIWENQSKWLGEIIQVKTMGLAARRLRMPVYNGLGDGDVDLIE